LHIQKFSHILSRNSCHSVENFPREHCQLAKWIRTWNYFANNYTWYT